MTDLETAEAPRHVTVAGRELDALVAEKVMGWHLAQKPEGEGWSPSPYWQGLEQRKRPPAYSTDIAAAWQVLDVMVFRVGTANIRLDMEDYGRGFLDDAGAERAVWVTIGEWTVCGPAPLAICRAALAAVGVTEQQEFGR